MTRLTADYHEQVNKIINQMNQLIIGKDEIIVLTLTALLANRHVLLEDVPGVGKTMLVKALARTLDCDFNRIQFTPDLLPSDVTGVSIYNPKTLTFEFRHGPIFGNVILADEINRTSPKTQSALLESMEEKHVTVDGETRTLQHPFFVMATQNPIEYEGTYALPEAQLDRFLFKLNMGYPSLKEEVAILKQSIQTPIITDFTPVISQKELHIMMNSVQGIHVSESIQIYIAKLARKTRNHPDIYLGVSPRAAIALMGAAQAYAYIMNRRFVIPDDIQYLAPFVFSHRLVLTTEARYNGRASRDIVEAIIQHEHVPIQDGVHQ